MAKREDTQQTENNQGEEVKPTEVAKVEETKNSDFNVPLEKMEDYFSQIASYVDQVNNGSMRKDTAIYLSWRLLSEIK
jgi:hypothetical protein